MHASALMLLAGGTLHAAMAGLVFLTRPDRAQNRFLAAHLFLLALWLLGFGLQLAALDPRTAYALTVANTFPVLLTPLAYALFLSTLPSPLAEPLRRPPVRAAFALLSTGFVASLLLWPRAWQEGMVPGPASPWLNVPGPLFGLLDAIAMAINLAALAIAVSAWRRASSPLLRRQMNLYVIGFCGYDAAFIGLFALILHTVPATGDIFAPPELLVALPPFALATTLWLAAWLGYGVLGTQLFDIHLKLKLAVEKSTLLAAFAVAFLVVSELVERALGVQGEAFGLAAAVAVGLVFRRVEALAQRVADRALPGVEDTAEYRLVRKRAVYRLAVEGALQDGVITSREREVLARLQDQLGLGATEALGVEREAAGAGPGSGA